MHLPSTRLGRVATEPGCGRAYGRSLCASIIINIQMKIIYIRHRDGQSQLLFVSSSHRDVKICLA